MPPSCATVPVRSLELEQAQLRKAAQVEQNDDDGPPPLRSRTRLDFSSRANDVSHSVRQNIPRLRNLVTMGLVSLSIPSWVLIPESLSGARLSWMHVPTERAERISVLQKLKPAGCQLIHDIGKHAWVSHVLAHPVNILMLDSDIPSPGATSPIYGHWKVFNVLSCSINCARSQSIGWSTVKSWTMSLWEGCLIGLDVFSCIGASPSIMVRVSGSQQRFKACQAISTMWC